MEKEKKDKKVLTIKYIIIAIFLVTVVLIYFNYIANKSSIKRTKNEISEVEQLSEYNMVDDYPKTPRDVVKLHNRYFKLFYGKELSDDELVVLNRKIRYLYAEELIEYNSENTMIKDLKTNIDDMNEEGYSYLLCELPEPSQVKFYTQNGKEMASLEITITVSAKDSKGYLYHQYVLVKENEQWKILAWGDSTFGNNNSTN